jgi:hypothetical protein
VSESEFLKGLDAVATFLAHTRKLAEQSQKKIYFSKVEIESIEQGYIEARARIALLESERSKCAVCSGIPVGQLSTLSPEQAYVARSISEMPDPYEGCLVRVRSLGDPHGMPAIVTRVYRARIISVTAFPEGASAICLNRIHPIMPAQVDREGWFWPEKA